MSTTQLADDEELSANPLTEYTGFQRDLLVAIADLEGEHDDGISGQDVRCEVESVGYGDINHGRLYPNLDILVEGNLVAKGEIDRRTNSYELSALGEIALDEYREYVGA